MIEKAKEVGCWAVKFQIFTKKLAKKANIPQALVIGKNKAGALVNYGKDVGIPVFFSVMYPEAFDWLFDTGVRFYKIRFADNQNCTILLRVLMTNKPFFISYNEIVPNVLGVKTSNIRKLFCVPKYPAKIKSYFKYYSMSNHFVGISDHTKGTLILKRSIKDDNVMYFEKHVKLNNKCMEAAWSVTFDEIKEALKE